MILFPFRGTLLYVRLVSRDFYFPPHRLLPRSFSRKEIYVSLLVTRSSFSRPTVPPSLSLDFWARTWRARTREGTSFRGGFFGNRKEERGEGFDALSFDSFVLPYLSVPKRYRARSGKGRAARGRRLAAGKFISKG